MIKIEYKESIKGKHFNTEKSIRILGIKVFSSYYSSILMEEDKTEEPEKAETKRKIGFNYEN